MTLKKEFRIEFTQEEKDVLYKADEIFINILDLINLNNENGNAEIPIVMPESFWRINHHVLSIEEEVIR